MEDVVLESVEPLKEPSVYVAPQRITYTQNGKRKTWDMVKSHSAVAVIIYNTDSDKLVLVSQFRPPVYCDAVLKGERREGSPKASSGICYELCAGIMDGDLTPEETAKKEILEETGFKVDSVEKIGSWVTSVALSGASVNLFYARVNEKMRLTSGGGLEEEGEMIKVLEFSPEELQLKLFSEDDSFKASVLLMFGYYWFMAHKYPQIKKLKE